MKTIKKQIFFQIQSDILWICQFSIEWHLSRTHYMHSNVGLALKTINKGMVEETKGWNILERYPYAREF